MVTPMTSVSPSLSTSAPRNSPEPQPLVSVTSDRYRIPLAAVWISVIDGAPEERSIVAPFP